MYVCVSINLLIYICRHRRNDLPTTPIIPGQINILAVVVKGDKILTFFGWNSSSVGYHFWAFWAGTVLSPFPNFFVWPTAFESDILAIVTKIWKRRKLGIGGGPSCRWLSGVEVVRRLALGGGRERSSMSVCMYMWCFCGIPCPIH